MIRLILCIAVISGFMASTACAQGKTELAKEWLKFLEGDWESSGTLTIDGADEQIGGEAKNEIVAGGLAVIGRGNNLNGDKQALILKITVDGSLHLSGAQSNGLMWSIEFDEVSEDVLKGKLSGSSPEGEGSGSITWKRSADGGRVEESEVTWNGSVPIKWTSTSKKK